MLDNAERGGGGGGAVTPHSSARAQDSGQYTVMSCLEGAAALDTALARPLPAEEVMESNSSFLPLFIGF